MFPQRGQNRTQPWRTVPVQGQEAEVHGVASGHVGERIRVRAGGARDGGVRSGGDVVVAVDGHQQAGGGRDAVERGAVGAVPYWPRHSAREGCVRGGGVLDWELDSTKSSSAPWGVGVRHASGGSACPIRVPRKKKRKPMCAEQTDVDQPERAVLECPRLLTWPEIGPNGYCPNPLGPVLPGE